MQRSMHTALDGVCLYKDIILFRGLSKPPLAYTFYHSAYVFRASTIKHCHPRFLPQALHEKTGALECQKKKKSLGLDMFDSALRLLNYLFMEHIPYSRE